VRTLQTHRHSLVVGSNRYLPITSAISPGSSNGSRRSTKRASVGAPQLRKSSTAGSRLSGSRAVAHDGGPELRVRSTVYSETPKPAAAHGGKTRVQVREVRIEAETGHAGPERQESPIGTPLSRTSNMCEAARERGRHMRSLIRNKTDVVAV
jgi:hypothetical protein